MVSPLLINMNSDESRKSPRLLSMTVHFLNKADELLPQEPQ